MGGQGRAYRGRRGRQLASKSGDAGGWNAAGGELVLDAVGADEMAGADGDEDGAGLAPCGCAIQPAQLALRSANSVR